MSHNLAFDQKTGEASLYLLKEAAWHKLGQVVEEAKNSDEILKIAHLDWEVEKVPNFVNVNNEWKESGSFSTIRKDTGDVLGALLGNQYQSIQNKEAFDFIDSLVKDQSDVVYHTAGALGKGEIVFITAKLPKYLKLGKSDIMEEYLLFSNTHNGGGGSVQFTNVRVVCNNTYNMAMRNCRNRVSLRHTSGIHDRLKLGRELIGLATEWSDKLADVLQQFNKLNVTDTKAKDILNYTFLTKDEIENLALGKELSTRRSNFMQEVYNALYSAPGQNIGAGTGLWVMNGVTSFLQNVKSYKTEDRKMKGVMFNGEESIQAQKAFDMLVSMI